MRKKIKTRKLSFTMAKKVTMPVKVKFRTRAGEKVSFNTTKKVAMPVKVTFHKRVGRI